MSTMYPLLGERSWHACTLPVPYPYMNMRWLQCLLLDCECMKAPVNDPLVGVGALQVRAM